MADRKQSLWHMWAEHELEEYRIEFEAGSVFALLRAIDECARHQFDVPEWASKAFTERVQRIVSGEVRTLDEAFGFEREKRVHFERAKLRERQLWDVYSAVTAAIQRGEKTGPKLWERLGPDLGISASQCSKLYFRAKRIVRENPEY